MHHKKTLTLTLLTITVVALSAFMPKQEVKQQPPPEVKFKNLKVLPKNINKDDLDKVMDGFKVGLGVRCNFCHVPMKDNPKKMDFASDEKEEKLTARAMMKMTAKINKKYFHDMKTKEGAIIAISCVTCHNGKSEPVLAKI